MTTMLPISVLDLSFTTTSTPGALALRQTIELAKLADDLGFRRFWVAEHHNLPSVASGAPEIMIGRWPLAWWASVWTREPSRTVTAPLPTTSIERSA